MRQYEVTLRRVSCILVWLESGRAPSPRVPVKNAVSIVSDFFDTCLQQIDRREHRPNGLTDGAFARYISIVLFLCERGIP